MADKKAIAWVEVIPQQEACGDLATAYNAVKDEDGEVENLYLAMSQTPQAIKPADDHYRALLHNKDNPLEPWLAELVSTYVAILCGCDYAARNHGANFAMYLGNQVRADEILAALRDDTWETSLQDQALIAALRYTRKLSLEPSLIGEADIEALRSVGFCDKGISYLVQLVASFAYWSRMINGLGIRLGKTVGISKEPTKPTRAGSSGGC